MVYQEKRKRQNKRREGKDIEEAKQIIFRFLSYRSRSTEEIKNKLEDRGFPPAIIQKTIARLQELGYINDYDFAFRFGRACVENKQWGTSRIRAALAQKGIASPIITAALQELSSEHDFTRVARRALEQRFPPGDVHGPPAAKRRRQAINYLRRKGFSWSTIAEVIDPHDDT